MRTGSLERCSGWRWVTHLARRWRGHRQESPKGAAERGLEMVESRRWEAGPWTDDTALALELAESIAECD